jgi:hypothetical protein
MREPLASEDALPAKESVKNRYLHSVFLTPSNFGDSCTGPALKGGLVFV